jgi:hypothetical protein
MKYTCIKFLVIITEWSELSTSNFNVQDTLNEFLSPLILIKYFDFWFPKMRLPKHLTLDGTPTLGLENNIKMDPKETVWRYGLELRNSGQSAVSGFRVHVMKLAFSINPRHFIINWSVIQIKSIYYAAGCLVVRELQAKTYFITASHSYISSKSL